MGRVEGERGGSEGRRHKAASGRWKRREWMKKEKKRLVQFEKQTMGRRWGVSISLGRARSPTERAEVRLSRPALWLVERAAALSPPPPEERGATRASDSDSTRLWSQHTTKDSTDPGLVYREISIPFVSLRTKIRRWGGRGTTPLLRLPGCESSAPRARWACLRHSKRWLSIFPAWTPSMRRMEVRWQPGESLDERYRLHDECKVGFCVCNSVRP